MAGSRVSILASWGFIYTPQASIGVNLGREDIVDSFSLRVRGGAEVLTPIADLLAAVDAVPSTDRPVTSLTPARLANPGRSGSTTVTA